MTVGDGFLFTQKPQEGSPSTPVIAAAGTAGTNVTAEEFSDGLYRRFTKLTLAGVAITIGDDASLGMGALIYTFPAGPLVVNSAYINAGLTLTTGTPTTDTPEMGLGTVIASGAVAVLGGTATFENIMGGAATPVLANIAGTKKLFTHVSALKMDAADAHTVHLNFADGWANVDNTAATANGTVILEWTPIPIGNE
jgi:hypothetical protein